MKILIIIFLTILTFSKVTAQSISIVDTNNVWFTTIGYLNNCVETERIFLQGDTVINSKSYKKVLYGLNSDWYSNSFEYLREDSSKVYLLEANKPEILLYDFNVTLGDSITGGKVTDIDSVTYNDSIIRKRIKLAFVLGYFEYWLEGIGSDRGLLASLSRYGPNDLGVEHQLYCFSVDNNLVYSNDSTNTCVLDTCYISSIPEKKNQKLFDIYVSPLGEIIVNNIAGDYSTKKLTIYDQLGKLVYNEEFNNNTVVDSNFNRGIYLVIIRYDKGVFINKIILLK